MVRDVHGFSENAIGRNAATLRLLAVVACGDALITKSHWSV
jgi:hypothetical protein